MHRREVLVVTFLVSTLFAFSDAHTMGLGSCPRVEPLKDFNMDKVHTHIHLHFYL